MTWPLLVITQIEVDFSIKKGVLVIPGRTIIHKFSDPVSVEISLMHKSEELPDLNCMAVFYH